MARYSAKREEKKQTAYKMKTEINSRLFSELTIQILGLSKEPETKFLCKYCDDAFTYDYINYDGFNYVSFADFEPYQFSQTVKLFNPYTDLKLCQYILFWYIQNIYGLSLDDILISGISNNMMNDKGYLFIKFTDKDGKFKEVRSNIYNRDCIKYLDMIYQFEGAFFLEYNKLKEVDLVPYDLFNV